MLTDQGAATHTYHPEDFEDDGDAENGPHLTGGPAWSEYTTESHMIVIDHTGLIVHQEVINWALERWIMDAEENHPFEGMTPPLELL